MLKKIGLGLAAAGCAAVVWAQDKAEFDFTTLPGFQISESDNGVWVGGKRGSVGTTRVYGSFVQGGRKGYVRFDVPKDPADSPIFVEFAFFRAGPFPAGKRCEVGYDALVAMLRQRGFKPVDSEWYKWDVACIPNGGGLFQLTGEWFIERIAATPVAAATCKSDAYLGAWQRKGEGGQKAQVQIVFATERGASAPVGSTRGFASAPYGDGTVVASRIRQVGDGCTFDAQCGSNLSSANACKLVIDPAKNTLKVEGGSQMFVSDRVWTRTTPMAAETVCSREDVEGDWRRSDGANVPIVGVHVFKNGPGGNALLFNHPEGWWPKGQTKFTGIYREGGDRSCKLKATCATYDRTVSGNVVRRERACTLTIDPVKKRMTESGSSLFYTRDGAAKAAPAKPEAAAAVPTAQSAEEQAATSSLNAQQAATAKREIAEYEAQKKRIADEQAAKEAAYRKALADREALIAENERKAREARARWEAAAAACRAGDRSQCAPAPRP